MDDDTEDPFAGISKHGGCICWTGYDLANKADRPGLWCARQREAQEEDRVIFLPKEDELEAKEWLRLLHVRHGVPPEEGDYWDVELGKRTGKAAYSAFKPGATCFRC